MTIEAELIAQLSYDAKTGVIAYKDGRELVVRVHSGRGRAYARVHLLRRTFFVHRLAWLLATGQWPSEVIDHINGEGTDNRLENLRDVSNATNLRNRCTPTKANSSGFLGVSKFKKRWRAMISINNKNTHVGFYGTPEEAHAAYMQAKRRLHADAFCEVNGLGIVPLAPQDTGGQP